MRTLGSIMSISLAFIITSLRATCPTPNWDMPQSWQVPSVNYNFPTPGPPPPYLTNVSVASLGIVDDIYFGLHRMEFRESDEWYERRLLFRRDRWALPRICAPS